MPNAAQSDGPRKSISGGHLRRYFPPPPPLTLEDTAQSLGLQNADTPISEDNHADHIAPERRVKAADVDWRREAACTSQDPELFFPIGSAGPAVRQTERAKQICGGCPVQMLCLEWALKTGADHGVWGGLSEDDRQSLRRRRRRNAASIDQKAASTVLPPETAARLRTANAAGTLNRIR